MKKTNDSNHNNYKALFNAIPLQLKISIFLAVMAAVAISIVVIRCNNTNNGISLTSNNKIDITPTQIRSIENIGEWEFLTINDEEMVDTVRRSLFGNDELVRIYYGSVRLGINLKEAKHGWIKSQGDTVKITLPPIILLDNDFIDEAKTKPFIQKGKWSDQDRLAMYERAYIAMKSRCLTQSNIASARRNAETQFRALMRSMGFNYVIIRFDGEN